MKIVPGKTLGLVFGLSTFFVLAPSEAFAYIDPGTGSFIFQAVAGALIGVAFFVRSSWDRIRERVRQFFGPRRGD